MTLLLDERTAPASSSYGVVRVVHRIIITRAEIVEEARKFLGTPWKHQARLQGVGVDCIGLVHAAGRSDIALPSDYGRRASGGRLQTACDRMLVRIQKPALGSIALMRFDGEPHHVGIIGNHPHGFSLIHSYAAARKAVEHRLDDTWLERIVAFYDFPGVA